MLIDRQPENSQPHLFSQSTSFPHLRICQRFGEFILYPHSLCFQINLSTLVHLDQMTIQRGEPLSFFFRGCRQFLSDQVKLVRKATEADQYAIPLMDAVIGFQCQLYRDIRDKLIACNLPIAETGELAGGSVDHPIQNREAYNPRQPAFAKLLIEISIQR